MSKVCSKCKINKPYSEYHKRSARSIGICADCKQCRKEYHDRYSASGRKKEATKKRPTKTLEEYNLFRKKRNSYERHKRKNDPSFKISQNLRRRLRALIKPTLKDKGNSKYLGCSREELMKHLESKFKSGMTWENYGTHGWHVDHIIPLSFFDLTKVENISKLNKILPGCVNV